MMQNINLITKRRGRKNMALFASIALGVLTLTFTIWSVVAEVRLHRLADTTNQVRQTMVLLQAELQKKRHDAGLEDVQALAKESAQMQHTMDAHRALMQLIQKGDIGSLQGHSAELKTLATIVQTGVWLQGVDVTKAGQSMRLSGTALTTAAVIQYADQLNLSFKTAGTEFTALEIAKEDATGSAGAEIPKFSIIKFKIY